MRILLADNNYVYGKFMAKMLSQYGECDVIEDGEDAVDSFMLAFEDNEPYVLVCIELTIPSVDGYQVLKAIRSIEEQRGIPKKKRVKVIMMSEQNVKENVEKAFELGCDAFVMKPVDIAKVQKLLKKWKCFK